MSVFREPPMLWCAHCSHPVIVTWKEYRARAKVYCATCQVNLNFAA